jgi:predicted transcriptional regulator
MEGSTVTDASTLTVRVESSDDFHDRVERRLESIESGDREEGDSTLSVTDDATLSRIFDETTLALLRTIATHEPGSMRETARLVGRDVRDVSRQLDELAEIGVIEIESVGRSKRPIVAYDEIAVRLAVACDEGSHSDDSAIAVRGRK